MPDRPGESTFVYVTYIRTTPERLWAALTGPAFAEQYWMGMRPESDWTPGAPWRLVRPDGTVTDVGEVLEAEPGRRLVLRWRNEFVPELTAEGYSRCIMEIEPAKGAANGQAAVGGAGDAVKLTVTHTIERDPLHPSRFIAAVSGGWPQVLSNLKSLLETGAAVLGPRPQGEAGATTRPAARPAGQPA
jgi:uncharacterized protein YndB with AHSA1/START domain